jgi:hypothetical protein
MSTWVNSCEQAEKQTLSQNKMENTTSFPPAVKTIKTGCNIIKTNISLFYSTKITMQTHYSSQSFDSDLLTFIHDGYVVFNFIMKYPLYVSKTLICWTEQSVQKLTCNKQIT